MYVFSKLVVYTSRYIEDKGSTYYRRILTKRESTVMQFGTWLITNNNIKRQFVKADLKGSCWHICCSVCFSQNEWRVTVHASTQLSNTRKKRKQWRVAVVCGDVMTSPIPAPWTRGSFQKRVDGSARLETWEHKSLISLQEPEGNTVTEWHTNFWVHLVTHFEVIKNERQKTSSPIYQSW